MTCVEFQTICRVCADHGIAIGKTDLVRMVCNECGSQEVCSVNSVFPIEDGSKAESLSQGCVLMNVHAFGAEDCDDSKAVG